MQPFVHGSYKTDGAANEEAVVIKFAVAYTADLVLVDKLL